MSHQWQILGGFTRQRQKGVFGRGFSDEATRDNFNDPNNDINRKNNFLNLDATYVFKVDSTSELPRKFRTTVNFQHYTGFPIQPTETFSVPDGQGFEQQDDSQLKLQFGGLRRENAYPPTPFGW